MHMRFVFLLLCCSVFTVARAQQEKLVDGVLAVVGEKIVTYSEFVTEFDQVGKEYLSRPNARCEVFDQLMVRKLLIHQAELDSVPLDEGRVDAEIENKLRHYARMLGSERKLEEFLGKSLAEYKRDIRPRVREQMLSREMENKILSGVKISPREVTQYFNSIPRDSLPLVGSEVEVAELLIVPKVSQDAKDYAREKAEDLRKRVLKGESFDKLASAWSEDPGSALQGGLLPEFGRGDMVPEFERAAFRLKPDSISKVIESPFGFHIIKLISRRGERLICRHILVRPQYTSEDMLQARRRIDSAYQMLTSEKITWCGAVLRFDDQDIGRKGDCGFYNDETTGSQKVMLESLDKEVVRILEKMKPGEYSEPELVLFPDGSRAYRIIYLRSEVKPHIANLIQDYPKIQQAALEKKRNEALARWVEKTRKTTYISVNKTFASCPKAMEWVNRSSVMR
jgi:peptidyl-prolyl cis-trans isomerase SurA